MDSKNINFVYIDNVIKRCYSNIKEDILCLYDKDLIDVDPFDKELSFEMKHKILTECVNNFWYFMREVVRYDNSYTYLNVYDVALLFLIKNNIDVLVYNNFLENDKVLSYFVLWAFLFKKHFDCTEISFTNHIRNINLKQVI